MLWILRIALFLQLLLGLGRMFGFVANPRIWETHITLGVVIVILALLVLRPLPELPADTIRSAARFFPLVVLLTGLGLLWDVLPGTAFIMIHALLGLIAVALTEMAAGRQRRQLGGRGGAQPA